MKEVCTFIHLPLSSARSHTDTLHVTRYTLHVAGGDQAWRRCFMKAARIHHPDKGGDAEEFKKLNACNELLKAF